MKRTFIAFWLAVALSFSAGFATRELTIETLPECGLISARAGTLCYRVEQDYLECDTDSDCYEKNGCGGYADPCEEEPTDVECDDSCTTA